MTEEWREIYSDLVKYVEENPDHIKFTKNSTMLADGYRQEFYKRFDKINDIIVDTTIPDEIADAEELSVNWQKVKNEITSTIAPEGIVMEKSIGYFLDGPRHFISEGLYTTLIDVFKGNKTIDDYEKEAREKVKMQCADYFEKGYKYFLTLCIVNKLAPEKMFSVESFNSAKSGTDLEVNSTGGEEQKVPQPRITNRILFEEDADCNLLTPKIILKKKDWAKMIGIRCEFHRPCFRAQSVPRNQEWLNTDHIKDKWGETNLWPDIFIITAEDYNDINLIADYTRMCRPDIAIEVEEETDWFNKKGVKSIKRHSAILEPRYCTYILSRDAFDSERIKENLKPEQIDPETMAKPVNMIVIDEIPETEVSTIEQNDNDVPSVAIINDNNEISAYVNVEDNEAVEDPAAEAEETESVSEDNESEVTEEPAEEPVVEYEPEMTIKPIKVGYDLSMLDPVINQLLEIVKPE